ncbi:MAG: hypothetical protein OXC80_00250, partial [Gammaproteobacteria bacterium]|nr:hypothetical protein [Gammaproteobacteria bacterium]
MRETKFEKQSSLNSDKGGHFKLKWARFNGACPYNFPSLVLLFGALSLFHAVPVQAQVWSATLTADQGSGQASAYFGCTNDDAVFNNCSSSTVVTEDEFTYGGTSYTVTTVQWRSDANRLNFAFSSSGTHVTGPTIKTALSSLTMNVDSTALAISSARTTRGGIWWTYDPATDWT